MKIGDWIQPKHTDSLVRYLTTRMLPAEINLFFNSKFKTISINTQLGITISLEHSLFSNRCGKEDDLWLYKSEYKQIILGQMLLFDLSDTDVTDDTVVSN